MKQKKISSNYGFPFLKLKHEYEYGGLKSRPIKSNNSNLKLSGDALQIKTLNLN